MLYVETVALDTVCLFENKTAFRQSLQNLLHIFFQNETMSFLASIPRASEVIKITARFSGDGSNMSVAKEAFANVDGVGVSSVFCSQYFFLLTFV